MTDDLSLIKSNPLLPAENFDFLKQEGIGHIEQLGSERWNEYNTSDPGITILEAVSYAITDLAYRTSFDVKDLLTPAQLSKQMWDKIFYTARQILHGNPVTISDWRKVIIDTDGVRNAWVEVSKDYEVPIYVDYDWVQTRKTCEGKPCFGLLSLQPDATEIKKIRTEKGLGQDFKAAIEHLEAQIQEQIKKLSEVWFLTSELDPNVPAEKALLDQREEKMKQWIAEWKLIFTEWKKADSVVDLKKAIQDQIERLYVILLKPGQDPVDVRLQIKALLDELGTTVSLILGYLTLGQDTNKIVELNGLYNIIIAYEENIVDDQQREEVRDKIIDKLHQRRNLCEDFLSFNAVDYDDFTVDALIVVEEHTDPDELLAQIAFAIYRYFSPRLGFYTIDQMLAKGYTVAEVFEGPALKHGFIDTEELENTDLFRDLRLSDLIHLISDIKGIVAVTNFYIPVEAIDDHDKDISLYFDRWIAKLRAERKMARFDLNKSKFTILKENSATRYNSGQPGDRRIDRPARRFEDLKSQDQAYKLHGHQNDFPIEVGENMDLEDYFPIQYSLPMVYGVGEREILPPHPTDTRTLQAYQLKGYMQFFEQIVSDYHAQLNHLNDLFSFDENVQQTYYTHLLKEIHNFKDLILDYDPVAGETDEEVMAEFAKIIQHFIEPPEKYHARRNTLLNHLLARFNEDLTEYEALCRYMNLSEVEARLIGDKIGLLQDYPKVSSQRGKGFNYQNGEQIWNTDNITGAERRLGRLLGFKNIQRRTLAPTLLSQETVLVKNAKGEWVPKLSPKGEPMVVIKIVDECDALLLTSNEIKNVACCVDEFMNLLLAQAESRKNYHLIDRLKGIKRGKQKDQIGEFGYTLLDAEGYEIGQGPTFKTKNERDEAIQKLMAVVELISDNEGMHLVEHILLRPKLDSVLPYADFTEPFDNADVPVQEVDLLRICLDPCDLNKGVNDRVDKPEYRVRISRIPAEKCYNDEPWVLQILNEANENVLFAQVLFDEDGQLVTPPYLLTFRRYEALNERLDDLRAYGAEPDNYKRIVYTEIRKPDAAGKENSYFSFRILNEEGEMLAQTRYHDLLADAEKERDALVKYFAFQRNLYCEVNPCDHHEDPYSFRVTIVLPCWSKRFRNPDYRHFVEKTIHTELPAHIQATIKWVGIGQMQLFEEKYCNWLEEFMTNYYPEYGPVNELVRVLNNLKECGDCEEECSGKLESSGLDRSSLERSGLERSGLDRSGLDRPGPEQPKSTTKRRKST
ncbi:hypothetical protein CLV98_107184 [Dyadobacter jejuensis]|uniref:Uncharacterized protein n=1 Tax=Dyadobacter jejuensis TaxID=1082580 RepID=A0A316AIE6_9BACT|nr:hypothetical protein [Dyadobacter jejuensis]PWJ57476.1 hypothetical protein CLV98_107184 [Dyadobacter jejuensis]